MSALKQIAILITQIFFCTICFAQNSQMDRWKIDSLKKVLPSLRDSARIDCLNALFRSYYWAGIDSFKYYILPAYVEAIKINYIHGVAEALNNKAVLEMLQGNYPDAEKHVRQSLEYYNKTSNKINIAVTFLALGSILYYQSDFDQAIVYLKKSYEYSKKAGDEIEMFLSLEQIGSSYMESGDYENAFIAYRQSLQLILKINNDYWIIVQLERLGQLYRDIEDYTTALSYFRQAYQRLKPTDTRLFDYYGFAELFSLQQQFDSAKHYYNYIDTTKYPDARLLISLTEYYFLQKQYDKALNSALRGLSYIRKYNDQNQIMRTLLDIAKIYAATRNNDSSFYYAKEGLMMAKKTGARQFILDAYHILYSVYDNWHETDSAYFYYRQYITLKDSILTDQIKGKLVAYSYEQKIELLNKVKNNLLLKILKFF